MSELKNNSETKKRGIKDGPISREASVLLSGTNKKTLPNKKKGRTSKPTQNKKQVQITKKNVNYKKQTGKVGSKSGSIKKIKRPRLTVGYDERVQQRKDRQKAVLVNLNRDVHLSEKSEKRILKRLIIIASFFVFAAICVCAWYFMRANNVNVIGLSDEKNREAKLLAGINEGEFILTSGVFNAKSYIESDPYFIVENIRYTFPDTITIELSERVAVAALVGIRNEYYIDSEGMVLEIVSKADDDLVRVHGLALVGVNVGSVLGDSVDMRVSTMLDIVNRITQNNLSDFIISVDVSNPMRITLLTDTDVTVVVGVPEKLDEKFMELALALDELERAGYMGGTLTLNGNGKVAYTPPESSPSPENVPEPSVPYDTTDETPQPSTTQDLADETAQPMDAEE